MSVNVNASEKIAKAVLGKLLPGNSAKYLRYLGVRAKEACGVNHFPASNELDKKLLRYVGNIEGGIFIEAGANDGLSHSNTWHLERSRGWTGLLVEPVPENAELCRTFRNAQVECCAIGSFEEEGNSITLHFGAAMTVAEGADERHLSGGSVASHAETGANWVSRQSYSFSAQVHALSTLIDNYRLPKVDLLSLDVEGYEIPALKGIDFDRHPVRFILVETSNLKAVIEALGDRYAQIAQLSYHDYLFEFKAGMVAQTPAVE